MFFGMMRAPLVFEAWEKAGLLLHQVLHLEQEPHRALAL